MLSWIHQESLAPGIEWLNLVLTKPTLFNQKGVHYEFGPEYEEYTAKKQAGTVESEEQLDTILIDNKVRENYFGQLTDQL